MRHAEQQARRLLLSTTASCLVTALFIASNLPALADSLPDSTLSTFALPGIDKIPIPTTQIQEPDFSQLTAEERLTVEIFDRNTPSVVNIANLAAYTRKCVPVHLVCPRQAVITQDLIRWNPCTVNICACIMSLRFAMHELD